MLGPITLGSNARIGANAVVLKNVPKGATMVGIPAKMVMGQDNKNSGGFTAYGTPTDDLPDPIARSFDSLRSQLNTLTERVNYLEGELEKSFASHSETNEGDEARLSSSGS